nr:hypothetical protein KitaXyl93_71670 [Kitasatospora sp. Xyl93]
MAGKNSEPDGTGGIGDRPQDDFVARNLSDPSERPARTLTLSGLLGDSDRAGFRRLYFNTQLDYYAEFASADVLSADTVPGERPPFVGHDATTVTLRRDATVHFTRVQTAAPVDEFDLDLRLGQGRPQGALPVGPDTVPTWGTLPRTFGGCATDFLTRIACVTDFDCPTQLNTLCAPRTCVEDTVPFVRCAGPFETRHGCFTHGGQTCITCATCDTCVTCRATACPVCEPDPGEFHTRVCLTTGCPA